MIKYPETTPNVIPSETVRIKTSPITKRFTLPLPLFDALHHSPDVHIGHPSVSFTSSFPRSRWSAKSHVRKTDKS
jgi:hypothetical protein